MTERRRDQLFQKLRFGGRKHGQQSNENAGSHEQLDGADRTDKPGKNPELQVLDSGDPTAVLSPGHSPHPDSVLGASAVTMAVPENKNDGTKESLWTRAYNRCREEAPKLVEDYLFLLAGTNENSEDTNDPMQVANVVKKQKEIMEKKQWKLVFWHHEIIIREKIDHIVQAFRIFEGIGSAVASLDPVHAGIPWAGVCAILQLVTNDSEQHDHVLDGLVSITDLMNFYAQAESFYLSQNVNTEPLVELYKLVLEFQMLAAGYFARNTAARFTKNVLMVDRWSDKLTKVRKKDEECRNWVDLSLSKQIISKLDAHLSAVNNDAARAQQILKWISNISVRDQHVFIRESKLGRPYWDTGRWLIEHREFRQWAQSSSGIFYLEGGVGVGKSCLVSAVLEEYFKASLDRLGFFYCSRSTGDSFDSLSILRSILAQLSYTVDTKEIPHSIRQRYNNRLNNVDGGSLSLRDCEDHIIELASGKRHITIIIDALDECGDHDKLLSSLKRVYGRLSNAHVFFSSRSMHLKVTDYFQPFSPIAITILDQSKQEMQSFIETEIRSPDRRRNSCIEKLPELEKRFQDALVRRAGAMFRWAELQLDLFLNKKHPIRHWKDFESKLNKLISDSSLPTLNRAYDEIYLSNVEPGSFDEIFATKALRCILGAFQPLNVHQLVDAVAIDPEGEVDPTINLPYIMDICNNFIVVDRSDSVSLAHLSVREYLEQKKLDGKDVPIYTFVQTHRQLAESCLATILHTDLVDVPDVSSRQGFLRYAIEFWPSHCEKIPEERTTGTLGTLMAAIMSDKLSEWAVFARKISRTSVDSKIEFDELSGVPAEKLYSYIVCVWGFVEFFNDTVQGAKRFDEPQNFQQTPLDVASFHGHLELVRRIIDVGPEKEIQQASTAALRQACRGGHYEIAELLLSVGANPSPALRSSFCGDFDRIVKLLIDHGAVINPLPTRFIWEDPSTPLQLSSMQGHVKIVQVLVNGGAEINIPGGFYGSALQRASWQGHEDVVRFLLNHGADINFGNGTLVSPLLAAANRGHHEIMRFLLERGAHPDPFSDFLGSPLQWVSSSNLELVELLIKHGANANGHNTHYGAPLNNAAEDGQLEIVRFLLDSGADINAQVRGNRTALVSAARRGCYDVVQLLLERGVDVEKHGRRACWKASKHGHKGLVELLIGHGVQMPDQQDAFSSSSDEQVGEGNEDDGEDVEDDEDEDDAEDEEEKKEDLESVNQLEPSC